MTCTSCKVTAFISDVEAMEALTNGVMKCSKCKGPSTTAVKEG